MRVYLDNNATTFMRDEVRKVFSDPALDSNASSMYSSARDVKSRIEKARTHIADLVNCDRDELIFTSGASESNNTVLAIARDILVQGKKNRILTSSIEHPSVKEVLEEYMKHGLKCTFAPVDCRGVADVDFCRKELKKGDVALLSVMMVNNETGSIQPTDELCALAHEYSCLFHTDATQAAGKIEVDFAKMQADYLSLSAHKMYGPKGIGALVVKKDAPYKPFIIGGHQENGKRSGTYNSNAICGFGEAALLAKKDMADEEKRLTLLRDKLEKGLLERIENIRINSPKDACCYNTLNVSFRNVEGESILLMMDFEGIEVSTGSACATGSLEPSYVLLSCGVPVEDAHGSIRFSFGHFNTPEDVDYVLEKLPAIISRLRSMSTRS